MNNHKKVDIYTKMLKIRYFEEEVSRLFAEGKLPGFVHVYVGQEATAVGVCAALRDDDYITSTHRGHGHLIARGANLDMMMSELFGKATGYNKGKGGSMHIAAVELGVLGANGIVGAGIPIATGAALSAKLQKKDIIVACFFGDGGTNQGSFHEAVNIGAAFDLPIIYICENNLYGVGTYQPKIRKVKNIADRAIGYGIPGKIVDGNDILAVYETALEAVNRARSGKGPTLIECKTYRWHTHFEGEPDTYRPADEVREWKKKDTITRFRKKLLDEGVLTEKEDKNLVNKVIREVSDSISFAENSPYPELEQVLADVYA